MWKNVAERDRSQMTTGRMRIAWWIPKATHTHTHTQSYTHTHTHSHTHTTHTLHTHTHTTHTHTYSYTHHTHTHHTHTHIHTHKHTIRICNTHCFSTVTMVERTRLDVTIYVQYIACLVATTMMSCATFSMMPVTYGAKRSFVRECWRKTTNWKTLA